MCVPRFPFFCTPNWLLSRVIAFRISAHASLLHLGSCMSRGPAAHRSPSAVFPPESFVLPRPSMPVFSIRPMGNAPIRAPECVRSSGGFEILRRQRDNYPAMWYGPRGGPFHDMTPWVSSCQPSARQLAGSGKLP
ncbi:hypothetical protein BDV18DRAFT_142369 [Aspergillus unguis]